MAWEEAVSAPAGVGTGLGAATRARRSGVAIAALLLALAVAGLIRSGGSERASIEAPPRASEALAKVPLSFVPNAGQFDAPVRYAAQTRGLDVFATERKVVLSLRSGDRGAALELRFPGASDNATLIASRRGTGKVNYLRGSERYTDLATYQRLTYRNLWPGIDMVLRGQAGTLKYEFLVRPGADPAAIRLAYAGTGSLFLNDAGALLVRTPVGTLRDAQPTSSQTSGGRKLAVESRFSLRGKRSYGFALGNYDRSRTLTIDPGLAYSTYLGGSDSDIGSSVAADGSGSAYAFGFTDSDAFPTSPGAFDVERADRDLFITKLNADGTGLVYSTFLGGSSIDESGDIAVDYAGAAYVTGQTRSTDFPTTSSAPFRQLRGSGDAFVAKLGPRGDELVYSTYLGGSASEPASFEVRDRGFGIDLDAAGNAYVSGATNSPDFPTTPGAYDTEFAGGLNEGTDAFVTKLNAAGTALVYSTFLGGIEGDGEIGYGIAVDGNGAAYVAGLTDSTDFPTTPGASDRTLGSNQDGFVAKLSESGSTLVYSTFLGDTTDNFPAATSVARAIAVDSEGSAYVTGETSSPNFPTTPGAYDRSFGGVLDAFVTKLDPMGSGFVYSTYLGGDSSFELGYDIALDNLARAHVTGVTASPDFPTSPDAYDRTFNGPSEGHDVFVTKLDAEGANLVYSTYLGGESYDDGLGIAVDGKGATYVTGWTTSAGFPTSSGAFDSGYNGLSDAFVAKLDLGETQTTPGCTVSAGGRIIARNGDPAVFGGGVESAEDGSLGGRVSYIDRGPADPFRLRKPSLDALVCDRRTATVFGTAKVGAGPVVNFRMDLGDRAEPQHVDTYRILLSNGYDSGTQRVRSGSVVVRAG